MKSVTKIQLVIVVASIGLFVLLYFANKTPSKKTEANKAGLADTTKRISVDLQSFVDAKVSMLNDSLKKVYAILFKQTEVSTNKEASFDSITKFWDRRMQPDAAAFFVEKKAKTSNKAEDWILAGERYYYAIRFVKDQNEVGILFQNAIVSFEKGLKLTPNNTDAKIKLASCLIDGTPDPMKGISMLKEIEKTDSNNIDLQLTFAAASSKSGQWDKAIKRFNKVLELKPDYLDAYLYLADAYEKSGDNAKTIQTLEKFVSLTTDKDAKIEVKKYIDNLKSKQP